MRKASAQSTAIKPISSGAPTRMTYETTIPRFVIAALKGGAGKTFLTVGILGALKRNGFTPVPFKKGPDYIDAGWLGLAAENPCYNLDAYLCEKDLVVASFISRSLGRDLAVVEGNRGLFDGVDSEGSYSTAALAKLIHAPVILLVDATKVTRTAAAMVLGCRHLDPDLDLRAVILNRVAGARHEKILREAIEDACALRVIGSVRKLGLSQFPQRHLGVLPLYEHPRAREFVEEATRIASDCVDMDRVLAIAQSAPRLTSELARPGGGNPSELPSPSPVRIGIMRDSAFQFYYPENIELLGSLGGTVVEISALEPAELPELDALYIGGGFPETHAEKLAANSIFKESVRRAVSKGLPVYAECGGLMYLARELVIDGARYPMAGVFPIDAVLDRTPQGHGYMEVEVCGGNPFYPKGAVLRGHEFHYSYISETSCSGLQYVFRLLRGHGVNGQYDGICVSNALGTYLHVHALGEPLWAQGIIDAARRFQREKPDHKKIG